MTAVATVTLRQALSEEMNWINDRYDEVNFKRSHYDQEVIAIAEVNGERAELGRLVTMDDRTLKLGGMYVLGNYRGHGIAGKIIEFLLQRVRSGQQVFCIPFISMQSLYYRYGFVPVSKQDNIPLPILEKHNWCNQTYEQKTLLLILDHSSNTSGR